MGELKDSPGSKLKRTAEVWEGYTIPAKYLTIPTVRISDSMFREHTYREILHGNR